MKVSVVSNGSPDYLIDIVADGLIRLLGRDRIHLKYNQTSTTNLHQSQLFQGFDGKNKIDFLDASLLVASVRSKPEDLETWIRGTRGGKVAIIDGEDDTAVRQFYYKSSAVYFKREFLQNWKNYDRVRPLPFAAIPEDTQDPQQRNIPVTFSAAVTSPIRAEILKALKEMKIQTETSALPKKEYNAILSRSLVGISARGAGWDTYRYWETAYFGCALLSQRLGIVIPGNFVDGTEAIFFDGLGDFRKKLEGLLSDPSRAAAIGKNARKACLDRHLSIHRAKTVLESFL